MNRPAICRKSFREVSAVDAPQTEALCAAMEELNEMKALTAALDLAEQGVSGFAIFEALSEGIRRVDKRYEAGEYFLADLMMAAHIMRSVMETALVFPEEDRGTCMGRVVICTVQGDIHDLGKQVIREILTHNGFEVTDLGVDAAPDTVVQAIRTHKPHILILSGTLQASALSIRGTIRAVEASGLRKTVRIMVGGPAVKDRSPRLLGADARSDKVLDCLRLCHEFMAQTAGEKP
jgi:methanogenic corrinoid protein MtbC1